MLKSAHNTFWNLYIIHAKYNIRRGCGLGKELILYYCIALFEKSASPLCPSPFSAPLAKDQAHINTPSSKAQCADVSMYCV